MGIGGKFILDVGSGHKPHSDATHLCDLHFTNEERGNNLVVDRPFVNCSLEYLPFQDNTFSFVYACHVLEHVNNPSLAVSELARVADKGYVECPSYLSEHTYGWDFHKWSIICRSDKLYYVSKPSPIRIINMHQAYRFLSFVRIGHYLLDVFIGCIYMRVYWSKKQKLEFVSLTFKDRLTFLLAKSITKKISSS